MLVLDPGRQVAVTMASDGTPEAPARPPPDCTVISQLHITLRDMVSRLHDAIYMLPRQAPPPPPPAPANGAAPAPAPAGPTFSDVGYTVDLLEASKRFERLVALIVDDICGVDDDHFEQQLQALATRDAEVDESVARLTARLEFVQEVTRKSLRDTCEDLCADMVRCEEPEASEPEVADEIPVEVTTGKDSAALAEVAVKPRLADLKQDRSRRFIEELEFVQALANPDYVQHLATQKYFEDPAFIHFLRYLRYWRDPPYVHHIVYPQCLRMLEILLSPRIQSRLHRLDTRNLLLSQMMLKWATTPELDLPGTSASELFKALDTTTTYGEEGPPLAPPGQKAEILEDWTKLGDVVADKAWHEKIESLDAAVYTITHDAENIGRIHLQQQSPNDAHAERSFEKHRHYWENPLGSCDLETLAAAPMPAVQTSLEPSSRVLQRLGLPDAADVERHPKRARAEQPMLQNKRGRR